MTSDERSAIGRIARFAGGSYLSLAPLGIFSFVYVPSLLLVPGDPAATASKILASEGVFRLGVASHLSSQVVAVFMVLALYRILRPVDGHRAMVMVVLALLCVPISFVAEVNALGAVDVLRGSAGASSISEVCNAEAMRLLGMHRSAILLSQVFWALWLVPLGTLVFASGFLPRWLAVPVLVASAGYLVDSGVHVLAPGHAKVARFTAVGELMLPLWLLVRGIDVSRWQEDKVA